MGRSRRTARRSLLAAAAIVLAAVLAPGFSAGPARAQAARSPGQQIAAALRSSPLYVDPSLGSAFTPAIRTRLLQEMRKAPVPVYVLAVPLVNGGQWSSGEQLATVVQDYLSRPGVYLTIDVSFSSDIDAFTWPSDPQGLDAPPYHAADAAQAENLASDSFTTTLTDKFLGAVQLISSGKAVAADNAATRRLNTDTPAASAPARSGAGSGAVSPVLIAVLAIAVLAAASGGVLLVRRRRRRAADASRPRSVFASARTATEAELRDQAQQQVIALGELIEQPGGSLTDADQALTARALDTYEAAGKVLDQANTLCDLAGVLVLARLGFNAANAARAVQSGHAAPVEEPLCFFNPLHGEAARQIRWRPLGLRQTLNVHACTECADAAAQHRLPDALTDRADGKSVPYYEVSGEQSLWAATGYGQFGSDLVERILTRGVHPRR